MPGPDDAGLPEFERPPVIEVVLGVHFNPIRGITTAHLGLFWHFLGRDEWPTLRELAAITPQIERFDVSPTAPLRFALKEIERPELRLRFDNSDESKVVQIQSNLLLTHWVRKPDAEYPRYAASTKPGFLALWNKFCEFLTNHGFPAPDPLQWEVTYINRVPRGEMWTTTLDWQSLFRGVLVSPEIPDGSVESAMAEYHYRLNGDTGRLHINVRHVSAGEGVPESLDIILTARGRLGTVASSAANEEPLNITEQISTGLDIGRRAIVRAFVAITSEMALAHWGFKKEMADA